MHGEMRAKLQGGYPCVPIIEFHVFVAETQKKPDGLNIQGRVEIPIFGIRIATVGNCERKPANYSVWIDRDIKIACPALFGSDRLRKVSSIRFGPAWHQVLSFVNTHYFYSPRFA